MDAVRRNSLRKIPSVDETLRDPAMSSAIERHGRAQVTDAVREAIAEARRRLAAGSSESEATDLASDIIGRASRLLAAWNAPSPRRVVNLSGTIIHTNLGRAALPEDAVDAMCTVARSPVDLEFELETGERGDRDRHVESMIARLTGAEAATLVNNNAAAVLLVLNTLALRKEVPVSRGQLIEIGGSFRLPEIMARAGARLREVGTTNRTHLEDFRAALGPRTALLLEAHTSNYVITGFTKAVSTRELAELAHTHDVPLFVDLGSGALVDLGGLGLPREPTVADVVRAGADLVSFSGDKLLGGPQAGIIAGRAELVSRIKRNPIKRALRVDKFTIAALAAVLRIYADPERLASRIPVLRLLSRRSVDIAEQAARLAPVVADRLRGVASVEIVECESQVGSGALPTAGLASTGLALRPTNQRRGAAGAKRLAEAFRSLPVPVLGRLKDESLVFDLRCLEDEGELIAALDQAAAKMRAPRA